MVARDQTDWPATRQRDSVLRAEERRRESSRRWERWVEGSVDLGRERVQYRGGLGVGGVSKGCGKMRGKGKGDRGKVPAWFVARGCHGGELGGYGEDAIELAVGEGSGDGGGGAGEDSGVDT